MDEGGTVDSVEPVPVERVDSEDADGAEAESDVILGDGDVGEEDSEMVVPVESTSIKVERVDERELAESLSMYINLTAELDTETVLHVVSPKLFDHFSIFDLMLQKAKLSMDYGAMETLLNDTASVLSELKMLIESCLKPVKVRKWEEDEEAGTGGRRRRRKRYDESVEIDDMLAMALCLDSGVWKKRDPEDIDYYSSLLNVESLFPEKKERGPGRPRGSGAAQKKVKVKKEDDADEEEEAAVAEEEEEENDDDKEAKDKGEDDDEDYEEEEEEEEEGGKKAEKGKKRAAASSPANRPRAKKKKGRKPKIKTEIEEKERERFTCEKCGKTYVSSTALYKHIEKTCAARESMKVEFTRVEDDFFCAFPDCAMSKTVFPTKEDVDDHWAEHHAEEDDKIIPCCLCELKFATIGARKVHMNRDHEKKFKCDECDKTFFTKGNLNYHAKSHTKIKLEDGTELLGETYLCLKCGQTLCKAYGKQHEAKCTGMFVRHPEYRKMNEEYFCTVDGCHLNYGFNSIYGLRQHFHNAHVREEEKFFACDYCDEKFSFKTTRNKHVKAKHLKNYVCDICGKGFGGKDKLTSHRFTHTGEKPYSCDKCDYRAAKKYNLEMHKQSKHSDFEQKNYLCAICNKQFVTMGRVRRHMQVIHAEGKETSGKKKRNRALPPPSIVPSAQQHPEVAHHIEDQEAYLHNPHETVITVTPIYN